MRNCNGQFYLPWANPLSLCRVFSWGMLRKQSFLGQSGQKSTLHSLEWYQSLKLFGDSYTAMFKTFALFIFKSYTAMFKTFALFILHIIIDLITLIPMKNAYFTISWNNLSISPQHLQ